MLLLLIGVVVCQFLTSIEGIGRIVISANLRENKPFTQTGWHKITDWVTPSGTGHVASSASLNNGDFKAESAGLYNVFTTLTFSSADIGNFKVKVLINNDLESSHPGLVSTFQGSSNFNSLSVFGTVRLQPENTLSVYVYSDNDTNWNLVGSSESTYSLEFVGFFGYIPGFSSYLTNPITTNGTKTQIIRWKDYGLPGVFRSGTGFSSDLGTFAAICDGIYQISAIVRITNHEQGTFNMAIELNGKDTGTTVIHEEDEGKSTFSLFISLSIYFKPGDKASLHVAGTSSFTVETESSFSGVIVNTGGNIPGFSTVFFGDVKGTGRTWVSIPLPVPTNSLGQFEANKGSISSGKFYHAERQIFTVSGILNIEANSPSGVILTLHSDGTALNSLRTGIFTNKETGRTVSSYSIAGILELPADVPMQLFIYLSNMEEYKVLAGSRVSVSVTQQDYQAFHIVQPSPDSFSTKNTWEKLKNLQVKGMGSYVYTTNFNSGEYEAGVTGVYYLTANVIFQDANGPISIMIALNGDTSRRRSLYATKGNPASVKDSVSVSGALFIRKGDEVSLYAMVENDVSWYVTGQSTFSSVYVGQIFAVNGFSTVLKLRQPVQRKGWIQIKDWFDIAGGSKAMFSSGPGFNYIDGNYAAPLDGLYLVSASVKIQDGSLANSKFLLTVSIDGAPSSHTNQNGMQDYVEYRFPYSANDIYSMVISGALKLRAGQNVSIWLHSSLDESFSISQDSQFSIVYLSSFTSIYGSGAQVMLSESISQNMRDATSWKVVQNWKSSRSNTAPGVFKQGPLLDIDSDAGNVYILEAGLYAISTTISIRATYGSDINGEFEIGLFTKSGLASLTTKYTKTQQTVITMKLFGVLQIASEQAISIQVQSTTPGANWENLRAHCGFSIVRIPPFQAPASIISGLGKTEQLDVSSSAWSRVRHFKVNIAQTQELAGQYFFSEEGYFEARYAGIYLVSTSITAQSNITGYFIRMKIGLNGDTTLPGENVNDRTEGGGSYLFPECGDKCTIQMALILALSPNDKIGVYVQSNAPYLDLLYSTSLSLKYLIPLEPLPDGFSMQLKEPLSVNVYGDYQITGWRANLKGQYKKGSTGGDGEYLIGKTGLYLVAVNVEFVDVEGLTKAIPSLNNIPAMAAAYKAPREQTFSISISGIMKIQAGSTFTLIGFTQSDQFYKISDKSTSSITYIGDTSAGFTATRNNENLLSFEADLWTSIKRWSTSGKDFLFENQGGFESKEAYIVQESGFYYVSVNIILTSLNNATSQTELALVHNNINDQYNGLYATDQLMKQGTITLQVSGGIYLSRWDYLTVQLKSGVDLTDVTLAQESTFSILKIGEDLSSNACNDLGPNIVGQILPDNKRVPIGDSISWDCFATGENAQYQWTKDYANVGGAISRKLSLANLKISDSGDYVCTAIAGGITAASNIAVLTVYEPLPMFINPPSDYTVMTKENGEASAPLLEILVKAESSETSLEMMTLSIESGDPKGQFSISPTTSNHGTTLSRIKPLDREDIAEYDLVIEAINNRRPSQPVTQIIKIIVKDENDNKPIFLKEHYNTTLPEDTAVGTEVIQVSANDVDTDDNAIIRYRVIPGTARTTFTIDPETGKIVLSELLDREKRSFYVLIIEANDGVASNYTELSIVVADVNEHQPVFRETQYSTSIKESIGALVPILTILAEDDDSGENARIIYTIVDGDPDSQFGINGNGILSARKPLDYETNSSYVLTVQIEDGGTPTLKSDQQATVVLYILNTNDNRPIFSEPEYTGYVKENTKTFLDSPFKVFAEDPDGGQRKITYSIQPLHDGDDITQIFEISAVSGIIQIQKAPDYEQTKFYRFTVEANDNEGLKSFASVVVFVKDVNDNNPRFNVTSGAVSVPESISNSFVIYTVNAVDGDADDNEVKYKIVNGNDGDVFGIDKNTGAISKEKSPDREKKDSYLLNITAYDSGDPVRYASNSFFLQITITDSNDNLPKFDEDDYKKTVMEDAKVGYVIMTFMVTDNDEGLNAEVEVAIQEQSFRKRFEIQKIKENTYEMVLNEPVNYEDRAMYSFTMRAHDKGDPQLESSATVTITVGDVNDNYPTFAHKYSSTTLENNPVPNLKVYQVVATDADPGPNKLTYEIMRSGNEHEVFEIDKNTGIIKTTKKVETTTLDPSYTLKIVAIDSYLNKKVSNVTVLYIRLSHKPTIRLNNIKIGAFQFEATIDLSDFSHLDEVVALEIAVQQYHPYNPNLYTYGSETPATWYTVFKSGTERHSNNFLRRYVSHHCSFPLPKDSSNCSSERRNAIIECSDDKDNAVKVSKNEKFDVVVGSNMSCITDDADDHLICNGPLGVGISYRVQARVFECGSLMPIDSHFSIPVTLPPANPEKATLEESVSDGMLALASTFIVLYCFVFLVIVVYVCWKRTHEIVHIDHLQAGGRNFHNSSDRMDKIFHPTTSYISPRSGRIQRMAGYEAASLWPNLSMTEKLQGSYSRSDFFNNGGGRRKDSAEVKFYNNGGYDDVEDWTRYSRQNIGDDEESIYGSQDILNDTPDSNNPSTQHHPPPQQQPSPNKVNTTPRVNSARHVDEMTSDIGSDTPIIL